MKKIVRLSVLFLLLASFQFAYAQQPARVKKAVFQAFWWDYWNSNFPNGWANYLAELAPRLKAAGFDAVWIPPTYKNASTGDVGYGPFDMYDLGDKYQKGGGSVTAKTRVGTKDELLRMIAVMHANGIEVIQDVVMNHNNGAGTRTGQGGQDPEANYSMITNNGFKNFRFTSFATPFINDSINDYFSRSGRWAKNYTNFHPNAGDNCTTGDICSPYFGPDISYNATSIGKSSNIPDTGYAVLGNIRRPFYNPAQPNNYMRDNGRNWIMWFKKQTGSDGWRWDAVKHFPLDVQEDYIYNSKYGVPDFAKGGTDMFNVGEWIGSAADMDAYVNGVKTGVAPGNIINEKHTGTFDFSLRGYGATGGIYSMVSSNGGYNMQNLPGDQQGERYMTYPDGHIVYRTVPFVNSHDSYRPKLTTNGNYSTPLGVDSGWNVSNELGGNGRHIDPREPRFAAAYAAVCAVDGNPDFFFEDFFDIGTTGKRYSHLPANATDLPARSDLLNILQSHQKLGFKDADYKVPTSLTGADAPFYQKGNSGDHLVIERAGKAVIGITDTYDTTSNNSKDQEVYVTVDAALIGQQLYDYSGAHGIQTTTVFNDRRVLIKTSPAGHTIAGANGHGYSIWAPAPTGVTVSSVNDLYNYIATYTPSRNAETIQEWEMADDLGDSHCKSLGQGGRLPDSSKATRIVGKIYSDANKTITYKVYPQTDGKSITISLWDLNGNKVKETSAVAASAAPVTGTYTPSSPEWIVVKVRNTTDTQAGQKCWVNIAYTAPATINTRTAANTPDIKVSVWTGNKGTSDPTDCGNWEEGRIPDYLTDAIIPANMKIYPVVKSNLGVKNITIEAGASFTVDSALLYISGTINNSGIFDAIKGTIELFNTSVAQTVPANAFKDNTVKILNINNSAGVTLAGTLKVSDVLTPKAGILNSNGFLVIKSDSTGTARIAKGPAAGGYITGEVTIERYISPRAAWRLIAAPFGTSQTIHATWQENAASYTDNPAPGYGTHITGGLASNGFDQPSNFTPSILYYDAAMQMFMMPNSTNVPLSSQQGYLLLVKGDRSININTPDPIPTATVLRGKGTANTGDQAAINVPANSLMVVANPYASAIDFTKTARTNIADRYFLFDPNRGETGAFVLFEGPDYRPMNYAGYYNDSNTLIESSQAFVVEGGNTTGSITITENSKSTDTRNVFRTNAVNDQRLKVNLNLNGNATVWLLDNIMVRFDNSYSPAVNAEDAGKPENVSENISILNSSKLLTVDRRPIVTARDTVFLIIENMKQRAYSLELTPTNLPDSIEAVVQDLYLNTSVPVNNLSPTTILFSVTNDANSSAPGRFRIVFTNKNSLPISFTTIKAYQKSTGIEVDWNVATESNVHYYEVEKSPSGENFIEAGTVAAKSNNNTAVSYNWFDVKPFNGNNYYRIKAVENTGAVKYSSIVRVKTGSDKGEIVIYPNPIQGKTISIQFNEIASGKYSIELFNAAGQKVLSKNIQHSGNAANYSLQAAHVLAKGVYQMRISGGLNKTIRVVVE